MVVVLVVDTEGSPVVVGAAVVVVVSGQGLYRPKGAKTGRLQSGWKRPNILSSSTTRGLERRGEIRQNRKTEVFMALTSQKVETLWRDLPNRCIFIFKFGKLNLL